MQDIQPDVVTPEQLVNEILRREVQVQCAAAAVVAIGQQLPSPKTPSPDLDLLSPVPSDDLDNNQIVVDMVSRRGSTMSKAMSIEEVEEEENKQNQNESFSVENTQADSNYLGSMSAPPPPPLKTWTTPTSEMVILDCQNPSDFQDCHIRSAINVTFPAIMIRRIAAGKIDIFEKSKELKAKIANSRINFVVYDSFSPSCSSGGNYYESGGMTAAAATTNMESLNSTENNYFTTMDGNNMSNNASPTERNCCQSPNCSSTDLSDLVSLIARKLAQNGCRVATLRGGLPVFREFYPEWIDTAESRRPMSSGTSSLSSEPSPDPSRPGEVPLLGLGSLASLKIQDDLDACDSCIGLDPDDAFPVEIIPNLYLGNKSISSDLPALERHSIKHILNVTPDLPNVFEGNIRYLQIPISDHWTQSMLTHFVPAIQFIDEGRSKEEGVLVHCLAGISRSVTLVMAYLMYKMGLSLNEAYDIVRAKKANISPNFHFMGQLLDFERQLHSQFLSPPALGSSPDSGIEFDRWNTN